VKKLYLVLLIVLLLLFFVGIFGYINQDKLIDRYISHELESISWRYDLLDPDGTIKLVTVGTGSSIPSERVRMSNALFINGKFFLFDAGPGAARQMELLRLPLQSLEAIYITSHHADHILDLPEVIQRSWIIGRAGPLPIYGPDGVDSVTTGTSALLYPEVQFRKLHNQSEEIDEDGAEILTYDIDQDSMSHVVVYDQEGITISAFKLSYSEMGYNMGYRITYDDKTLVICGASIYPDQIVPYAQGADILLFEAVSKDLLERAMGVLQEQEMDRDASVLKKLLSYHASPLDAAQLAAAANVKKLILSHLGPAPENPISRRYYISGMDDIYDGTILLAEDGDLFVIN